MLNVVEFRRPDAPVQVDRGPTRINVTGKRGARIVQLRVPMACDPDRRTDQRLESVQANAKLTIDHAIATLEQNHHQMRAVIQKIGDASARAKLEAALNLIEQDLELAKLKSSRL
ncbi:hypothetical protein [Bradyrhizobium sp. UFLA05-112]